MLANRLLASHEPGIRNGSYVSHLIAIVKSKSKKTNQALEYQAADFVRALALLSRNSVPIAVAITWLAPRMDQAIGEVLKEASSDLSLAADLDELILSWEKLPSATLVELSQKLRVSLDRGTPVAQQLDQLAQTAVSNSHAYLLRKAGGNETKMLIPTIFLILPITILFTIYPSLSLLSTRL